MARLTLQSINKALQAVGASEELERGDGYFYFAGGNAHKWPATMVYVCRVNDLTIEQWVSAWRSLRNDYLQTLDF